ncbi:hypothetical protein GCM10010439_36800 [Actinocorallia aurantiaca]|uniref:Uncharacterized protein n=1 Tax=Actinocorallia aurantiaca TaxID=46204 RepID=A0ABN3UBU3_9ACTN
MSGMYTIRAQRGFPSTSPENHRPPVSRSATSGTAAIVPRGRWHRIESNTLGNIMAVTPPRGIRLEKRTEERT